MRIEHRAAVWASRRPASASRIRPLSARTFVSSNARTSVRTVPITPRRSNHPMTSVSRVTVPRDSITGRQTNAESAYGPSNATRSRTSGCLHRSARLRSFVRTLLKRSSAIASLGAAASPMERRTRDGLTLVNIGVPSAQFRLNLVRVHQKATGQARRQRLAQGGGHALDDGLTHIQLRRVSERGKNGAGDALFAVPPHAIGFAQARPQAREDFGAHDRMDAEARSGLFLQLDEQQQERVAGPLGALSLGGEEVPERLLVVRLAQPAFERDAP